MKSLKVKKYSKSISVEEIDCDELTDEARDAIKEAIIDAIQGKGEDLEKILRNSKK